MFVLAMLVVVGVAVFYYNRTPRGVARERAGVRLFMIVLAVISVYWVYDHVLKDLAGTRALRKATEKRIGLQDIVCADLKAPGFVSFPNEEPAVFITAYYLHKQTLYVLALGRDFFEPKLGANNIAFNKSFAFERLTHPLRLFPYVHSKRWPQASSLCTKVSTSMKDMSMHGKLHMMKCSLLWVQDDSEDLYLMSHSTIESSRCIRLKRPAKPVGRLETFNQRVRPSEPGFSLAIGGLTHFSAPGIELLRRQLSRIKIAHVYIGLNTEDEDLRSRYLNALSSWREKVTVSLAPTEQKDVVFSQGKLPFYNECLMHAKFYGDRLMGVWDLDEGLVEAPHQRDLNMDCSKTCYAEIQSTSFFTVESSTGLESFNRRAIQPCGNYSKAISCVENVDFIGVHAPESCRFYPTSQRFSAKTASFVSHPQNLRLAHLVNMWDVDRFANMCTTVRDDLLANKQDARTPFRT